MLYLLVPLPTMSRAKLDEYLRARDRKEER